MILHIWVGSGSGESLKTDKLEEKTELKVPVEAEIVYVTTQMRSPCSPLPFSNIIRLVFLSAVMC